jgi:hypothetical protein
VRQRAKPLHVRTPRIEKPGDASVFDAALGLTRFLVTSHGGAQEPPLCALQPWPGSGIGEGVSSQSSADRVSLSNGKPIPAGARPFLPPAAGMCPGQAAVNASAVGVRLPVPSHMTHDLVLLGHGHGLRVFVYFDLDCSFRISSSTSSHFRWTS